MSFTIYPAIDIQEGKCVRLFQGDYNLVSKYYDDPLIPALKWFEVGSKWLHIIDLDGARKGQIDNIKVIQRILAKIKINIQVGGGIRTLESARAYLDSGAQRVILGSVALKEPDFLQKIIQEFGSQKVIISLDSRNDKVFTEGWLKSSEKELIEVAQNLVSYGIKTFIYTDIEKDGTMSGPNIKKALDLAEKTGQEVIVAGGIGTEKDVLELAKYEKKGIKGVVIGRALYTGDIKLESLYKKLRGEE